MKIKRRNKRGSGMGDFFIGISLMAIFLAFSLHGCIGYGSFDSLYH